MEGRLCADAKAARRKADERPPAGELEGGRELENPNLFPNITALDI